MSISVPDSKVAVIDAEISFVKQDVHIGAKQQSVVDAIFALLPWLDRSPVKSIRYKGKVWISMILLFCASFIILGVLGVKAPTPARTG